MKKAMLGLLMLLCHFTFGAVWYAASDSGNDQNSGKTLESPFRSLDKAFLSAADGDTIVLQSGTYNAVNLYYYDAGIKKYRGKSVVIKSQTGNAGDTSVDCNALEDWRLWNNTTDIVRLENLTIKNGHRISANSQTVFDHCIITGFDGRINGSTYYVLSGGVLKNCLIVKNTSGVANGVIENCKAYNCTLTEPTYGCVAGYYTYLYNSIVLGKFHESSANGPTLKNCWRSDPGFVDATNGDYRLKKGSPCINVGDNSYVDSEKDLSGNPRIIDSRVDIGAYEYLDHTLTTDIPVQYSWLKEHYTTIADSSEEFEAKANETAANGHKVWECYVAGEDPTDSASKFAAEITVGEDGKPVVSWNPDLGSERVYKILGSTDLKTWAEVSKGEEASYNFFKVSVEMK